MFKFFRFGSKWNWLIKLPTYLQLGKEEKQWKLIILWKRLKTWGKQGLNKLHMEENLSKQTFLNKVIGHIIKSWHS